MQVCTVAYQKSPYGEGWRGQRAHPALCDAGELVGRVDVEFMEGPATGMYFQASAELAAEKDAWGSNRRARWFGL